MSAAKRPGEIGLDARDSLEEFDPGRSDDEYDAEAYVHALIAAFNPPDDDAAQVSVLLDVLDEAWRFIVAQPCHCPVATLGWVGERLDATSDETVTDYFGLQCARCVVLGRSNDRRLER